jgi:hypothetical protein
MVADHVHPFFPDREALAWAAGFFDGEGCFSYSNAGGYGVVSIGQTEREPLERFLEAVGGLGKIYGPYFKEYPGRHSKKPWFNYRAHRKESVQAIVGLLWFWLGSTKRSQAVRVLDRRATRCARGHRLTTSKRGCPKCHVLYWRAFREEKAHEASRQSHRAR